MSKETKTEKRRRVRGWAGSADWTSETLQAWQSEPAEIIVGLAEDGRKFLQAQVCPWDFSHLRQSTATPSGLPPKRPSCVVKSVGQSPSHRTPHPTFFLFLPFPSGTERNRVIDQKSRCLQKLVTDVSVAPSPLPRPGTSLPAPWRCAARGPLPRDCVIHKYSS